MACDGDPGRRRARTRFAVAAFAALAACSENAPSVLDPHGPGARRIEGLWWLMFWISTVVFVVVLALLVAAVVRRHRSAAVDEARWGEPFVVVAGVVLPSLILAAVFVVSLRDMNRLSARSDDARLEIEVIGHDWWWEARYPGGAVTANEIHIPTGEPVRLSLTSGDVIHSFWVPQLQAKVDLIPGQTNTMWVEADEPGRFRGQCAEFCGLQHANMIFYVVAEAPDDFDAWLANESEPVDVQQTGSVVFPGQEVFLNTTCAGCHAIRGTDASATAGPDLTHLMGRETIAAGVLPNDRTSLELWITDPQKVKPGATMPPTELSAEELEALLDYLEQLD